MFTVLNLCDAEKSVQEIRRVLKTSGLAIVSVASVWDKRDAGFLQRLFSKPKSEKKNVRIEKVRLGFHLFSKDELAELFARHGLALIHFDGLYSLQKPYWGWHREFTLFEKTKLKIERLFPKYAARIYFCVFRKTEA